MLRASGGRVPIGLRHASSGGGGGGAVKVNEPRTKKTEIFFVIILIVMHLCPVKTFEYSRLLLPLSY